MDNEIAGLLRCEENYPIIEIQVSLLAAASPERFLVSNCHSVPFKTVERVEISQSLLDEFPGCLFVSEIIRASAQPQKAACADFPKLFCVLKHPLLFFTQKPEGCLVGHPPGNGQKHFALGFY